MPFGDDIFWWYGLDLSLILGLFMLVPFWRGRADALTAWNFLLLGSIVHIGVGCMEVYAKKMHWPELKWFTPNSHETHWFLVGTTVFYVSLLFFHYNVRLPSRLLERRLAKWPELSTGLVLFVLGICAVTAAITPLVQNVPFIREIAIVFSHTSLATAVVFATVYWLKNRLSPFALMLMITAVALAAIDSMITFAGRRLLLTVALGPIAALYWVSWRYWSRTKLVAAFSVLGVLLVILSAGYATFRHMKDERTAANVIAKAKDIDVNDIREQLADIYHYLGQYTCHYSLLAMRLVDDGRLNVIPLDTLRHIACFPIPRALWPDKPRDECQYLSTDVLHMPYKTNWGVGITGQGYHDGGLAVLVLYALLASIMVRLFDVPLAQQPDNPFLLSALAAASAHIAAWPRGALPAMTLKVLTSMFLVIALAMLCRALFGTARNYQGAGRYIWRPSYFPPQ